MIDTNNIAGLIGAAVLDPDGNRVGSVGQVYVDDASGQPSWITVRTGLFGAVESFVPLDDVTRDGDDISIPYDKGFVRASPHLTNDGSLTPTEEDLLYDYYGYAAGGELDTEPAGPPSRTGDGFARAPAASDALPLGHQRLSPPPAPQRTGTGDAAAVTPASAIDGPHTGGAGDSAGSGRARLRRYAPGGEGPGTAPGTRDDGTR